jgi:lysozyme family protein
MSFAYAFEHTIGLEGGYSDNPNDRGGKTKYGITEKVARAHGYKGDMKDLPLDTAKAIAKSQYWDTLRLDDVCVLSPTVAHELFDTGYNTGVGVAGQFLQRTLNALNRKASDYGDVTVDGIVGPLTVACLREFLKRRGKTGEKVLLTALNALQGSRYIEISESRPDNEAFTFGWFANRVSV